MRRRPERQLTREDGYTLTEMLVVIGIICLIAAVLTPNLLNQLGRSKAKAAQLQLDTTASSIELFKSDVGRYPTQAEGLKALVQDPDSLAGWTGPYLKGAQSLNDPWNDPIVYTLAADGRSFTVQSLGADGKPGGTGLNADIRAPAAP
ncbi:MAG TPA: type II secretion system major pseudopilin GspG [Caulobacteraceae bacterium]|nr:type II secretion system major pseudopilin GspG [Caulobacteraceae bacterium]